MGTCVVILTCYKLTLYAFFTNRLRDPIALLHDMSYYTPKAAQAMLEWCNDRIAKNFDVGRQNPFQFSYVPSSQSKLVDSVADLKLYIIDTFIWFTRWRNWMLSRAQR